MLCKHAYFETIVSSNRNTIYNLTHWDAFNSDIKWTRLTSAGGGDDLGYSPRASWYRTCLKPLENKQVRRPK